MDSQWTKHKDVIQHLYVEERQTLANVKKKMESEYGFPKNIPESSYEVAIRDQLGLLKKLKKEHWPILYQRFVEAERRPFDLYLDGTLLYKWSTVWKELRRSRKTPMLPGVHLPPKLRIQFLTSTNSVSRYSLTHRPMNLTPMGPRPIASLSNNALPTVPSPMKQKVTSVTNFGLRNFNTIFHNPSTIFSHRRSEERLQLEQGALGGQNILPSHRESSLGHRGEALATVDVFCIGSPSASLSRNINSTCSPAQRVIPALACNGEDTISVGIHSLASLGSNSNSTTSWRKDVVLPEGLMPPSAAPMNQNPILSTSVALEKSIPQAKDLISTSEHSAVMVRTNQSRNRQVDRQLRCFIRAQVQTIPWNDVRFWLLASLVGNKHVYETTETVDDYVFSVVPQDGFFNSQSDQMLARICDSTYPNVWELEGFQTTIPLLGQHSQGYIFLNRVVYIFSNGLFKSWDDLQRQLLQNLLDTLQEPLYETILARFFESNLLSVRAAWNELLKTSVKLNHQSIFTNIIKMVLYNHPDWVIENQYMIITYLAEHGDAKLLDTILALVPSHEHQKVYYLEGIIGATTTNHIRCAKVLIEDYNMKWLAQPIENHPSLLAGYIIGMIRRQLSLLSSQVDSLGNLRASRKKQTFIAVLNLFLVAGANIDLPCRLPLRLAMNIRENECAHEKLAVTLDWYPSCLDAILYCDRSLFDNLEHYSSSREGNMGVTRSGLYLAALQGGSVVARYVESRQTDIVQKREEFLELILIEQIYAFDFTTFKQYKSHLKVARGLMEYGICPGTNFRRKYSRPQNLLARLLTVAGSKGFCDDISFLLECLVQQGATVSSMPVFFIFESQGTKTLKLLRRYGLDMMRNAGNLLLNAVLAGNIEAVEWLLENGADIDAEIRHSTGYDYVGGKTTILGAMFNRDRLGSERYPWKFSYNSKSEARWPTLSMLRQFIEKGAKLWLTRSDKNPPLELLKAVAQCAPSGKDDVDYGSMFWFLATLPESEKLRPSDWHDILDTLLRCHRRMIWRMELFEAVSRKYCGSNTAPFLATLIEHNAKDEVIQDAIARARTNDLNTHLLGSTLPLEAAASVCNAKIFTQLLDMGADINARGRRTPLQAICEFDPVSAEEAQQQTQMIKLLLDHGANVNAKAPRLGSLALQSCVMQGNLGHVVLLVEHGADLNEFSKLSHDGLIECVLDIAVRFDRLDIAQFLLKLGALSSEPGETGYDQALKFRDVNGNEHGKRVKELIRQHMCEQEKMHSQCPDIRAAHQNIVKEHDKKAREIRESYAPAKFVYDRYGLLRRKPNFKHSDDDELTLSDGD